MDSVAAPGPLSPGLSAVVFTLNDLFSRHDGRRD
jgi:hypothetical protein